MLAARFSSLVRASVISVATYPGASFTSSQYFDAEERKRCGSHGIDIDTLARPLVGQSLGQLGHATFSSDVRRSIQAALERHKRGDVDD